MLDRRPTSDPEVVEVTFRLPAEVGAESVHVVGDFNEWSRVATPLQREGDGFTVTLPLSTGAAYQFRYLLDGHVWENDWAADDYVGNEFGGENSLLDLTNGSARGAVSAHVGEVHLVGAIDEPDVAAVEEALAVDSLATEARTVSEAAEALTPVAEGGLAAPPATAESPAKAPSKARSKAPAKDGERSPAKGKAKAPSKAPKKAGGSTKGSSKRSKKEPSAGSTGDMTKSELLEVAKDLDISGRSKMNKDELAKAVAAARKR